MEINIFAVILIFGGVLGLVQAIRFLKNDDFARNYIHKNPKAALFRKLFGEEKAYSFTKKIFAPLGIAISIIFIFFGIVFLL
jgi:hypothetical protein